MTKKATAAQNLQRIRIVYELLLSDTPRPDILQYAANNWGIKTRTIDTLIKKANDLIVEEANRIRKNALEKHLTQRAFFRHKALKEGDPRLAFEILKDETKLLGLYPSSTSQNLNIDVSRLTNEQLERIAGGENPVTVLAAPVDGSESTAEVSDEDS